MFVSPVTRLEKDHDQTRPRPIRTANSQDRKRLKLQSSLRSWRFWEFQDRVKTSKDQSRLVFTPWKQGQGMSIIFIKFHSIWSKIFTHHCQSTITSTTTTPPLTQQQPPLPCLKHNMEVHFLKVHTMLYTNESYQDQHDTPFPLSLLFWVTEGVPTHHKPLPCSKCKTGGFHTHHHPSYPLQLLPHSKRETEEFCYWIA